MSYKAMRIIFMIDNMEGFGGAQRVIAILSNQALEQKNEVLLLLTGNSIKSVYSLTPSIKRKCVKENNKLKKLKRLRKIITGFKPDIVISFLTMVNVEACLLLMGTKIPLVISERNDPINLNKREKLLSSLFYRYSNAMVVQTDDIKNKFGKAYHNRIFVIANPLVPNDIEKKNYSKNNIIIAVGRLNQQKNYPVMLRSFKDLLSTYPEYKLYIYGKGQQREYLEKLKSDLQLEGSVEFKGISDHILSIEKDADIFLMTSDYEGMPNALAEAMSIGLPCISTECDGGGAAELINNGINGILVPKGDKAAITDALNKLISDEAERVKIGNNAKELKKRLAPEVITEKWFKLIKHYTNKGI